MIKENKSLRGINLDGEYLELNNTTNLPLMYYEQAREVIEKFNLNDCKICFYPLEEYVVVNINNAFTEGKLDTMAEEIVNLINSYTEVGDDGNNIFIISKAEENVELYFSRKPYNSNISISIIRKNGCFFSVNI